MEMVLQTEAPPLHQDQRGGLRVGDSRVLLELVIRAFDDGATPEAIVQRYPTLSLADTYAVIAYYLRHRQEIADYLAERDSQANALREQIERNQPDLRGLRQRMLARQQQIAA